MATAVIATPEPPLPEPPLKRLRVNPEDETKEKVENTSLLIQFVARDGEPAGGTLDIPSRINHIQLQKVLNGLLQNEEPLPYSLYVNDIELIGTMNKAVTELKLGTEKVINVVYVPQAVFRVKPCTRELVSLPGHTESILCAQFSPDSKLIASGSGDTTVRIWDSPTNLPRYTCRGHKSWVTAVVWRPDGLVIASGDLEGRLILWNPRTGKRIINAIDGHRKAIMSIAWEPYHLSPEGRRLASCSRHGDIKIWDAKTRTSIELRGHLAPVNCLRWGEFLYSCSRDRTIRVWETKEGKCIRIMKGHGHWINHIALNTDYALGTPLFRLKEGKKATLEQKLKHAKERYDYAKKGTTELLVSASDDFTLFLYAPTVGRKPICRMEGHQQLVNHVAFSPDGTKIASASFDKSVRIWNGRTGKWLATLIGHVQAVYQCHWSADSRYLVSGSADSTVKIWKMRTMKMARELPGHYDEVFATSWSPNGKKIVSGGRDRMLKIWS